MELSTTFAISAILIILALGALLGYAAAMLAARAKIARLQTTLDLEQKHSQEKLTAMNDAEAQLRETFKALAAGALESNNAAFLQLAKENLSKFQSEAKGDLEQRQKAVEGLVTPLRESLAKVNTQIEELEKTRAEAYGGITEQVKSLLESQHKLHTETGRLVTALRTPNVRGRWGEIQLRRVVEIAEMLPYCDFTEQTTVPGDEGRLRPDLIVKLPGGKSVVVDAKAPMQAFLEAIEADDEAQRSERMKHHVRQIRDHIAKLSAKGYWEQFDSAPDFVVMFLPGESFFSAALEQDPGLIEYAWEKRVLLATPTTLIALLRAVAYGWRQERVAESAEAVSALGRELYGRLRTMVEHFAKVGRGLDSAVEAFNKTVGSLETRVLSSARRFTELGSGTSQDLPEITMVEKAARQVQPLEDEAQPALELGPDTATARKG